MRSLPLSPLPPITIFSAFYPSWTALCSCEIYSRTTTLWACCTGGTVVGGGEGGCPTQVSPQCPWCADFRSAPSWRSVLPTRYFTSRLISALFSLCLKRHPISPGIVSYSFPFSLLSWNPLCHAVMGLSVRSQWPRCQFIPVLSSDEPLPLYICVAPHRPYHTLDKGFIFPHPKRP